MFSSTSLPKLHKVQEFFNVLKNNFESCYDLVSKPNAQVEIKLVEVKFRVQGRVDGIAYPPHDFTITQSLDVYECLYKFKKDLTQRFNR